MHPFSMPDNSHGLEPLINTPTGFLHSIGVQHFKPDAVPPEVLHQMLTAMVNVRSSWDLFVLPMIVVQDAKQRLALAEATFEQSPIREAPLIIVFGVTHTLYEENWIGTDPNAECSEVSTETSEHNRQKSEMNREIALREAVIQATQLMVIAQSSGLATCPVTLYDEDKVKEIIGIWEDPEFSIAMLVGVGYSADPSPSSAPVRSLDRVFVNRLGELYKG